MDRKRVCIRNTNIPLPFGCEDWKLVDKPDYENITPNLLENLVSVIVGRDYHSCYIHDHMSIFSAEYRLDVIQYIVMVCCTDYLLQYTDPRCKGNILHSVVMNPNIEVAKYIINVLGDNNVFRLANEVNKFNHVPLETILYEREMFKLLLPYTELTENVLERLVKDNPLVISTNILQEYIGND